MDGGSWHCTGDRDQDHPMEKKCKKAKWLSEEALKIAVKRREAKSKGEKERYKHLNAEFQRIARRDKKAFLTNQSKSEVKWSLSVVSNSLRPLWTVAYQAPSMGFFRQEYWSGLPFPSPGDLPNPGIEPGSPTLQADALPSQTEKQ